MAAGAVRARIGVCDALGRRHLPAWRVAASTAPAVAYRANLAAARGRRYVQVDASMRAGRSSSDSGSSLSRRRRRSSGRPRRRSRASMPTSAAILGVFVIGLMMVLSPARTCLPRLPHDHAGEARRCGLARRRGGRVSHLPHSDESRSRCGLRRRPRSVPRATARGRLLSRVARLQRPSAGRPGGVRSGSARSRFHAAPVRDGPVHEPPEPEGRSHVPLADPAVRAARSGPPRPAGLRARRHPDRASRSRSISRSCSPPAPTAAFLTRRRAG